MTHPPFCRKSIYLFSFAFILHASLAWCGTGVGDSISLSNDMAPKVWQIGFKLHALRRVNSLSDFDILNHKPVWSAGVGFFFTNTTVVLDSVKGSTPNGPNDNVIGLGVRVSGGVNLPLFIYRSDFALGVSAHGDASLSENTIAFRVPMYVTLRHGSGSSHQADMSLNMGIGVGLAYNAMHYYDLFQYDFTQTTPAVMLEFGYGPIALRIDYLVKPIHMHFNATSYGDFHEYGATIVFYFIYKN